MVGAVSALVSFITGYSKRTPCVPKMAGIRTILIDQDIKSVYKVTWTWYSVQGTASGFAWANNIHSLYLNTNTLLSIFIYNTFSLNF